jgi:hypothetical protein
MRKTIYQIQKQPFITSQDVAHVLILIAIALLFCMMPTRGFGQPTLGHVANDAFSTFDSVPPPFPATNSNPAQTSLTPAASEVPFPTAASPAVDQFYAPQPEIPTPAAAMARPVTAAQFPRAQPQSYQPPERQQRVPQREVAVNTTHPFQQYWGVPNDPQTKITGKPMTVAELLTGTRSALVRCQLLRAYWELSGLLAIYHFRCETERLAAESTGLPQDSMTTLLHEQRRTAEMEFIKHQWVLAELLKQCKGRPLRESELPIPADYPLYPRYQTFANKIARSERTQYLGRMIPIQEQLIESKNGTWKAASGMDLNQRTMAFLDLTTAIIEYNKMIAEYALETIPSNVSQQQLVRAVVRQSGNNPSPPQSQTPQMATGGITLTYHEVPKGEPPKGVPAQPVEQMAYEYQIPTLPARNATPEEESVPASEAPVDPEGETTSKWMLNF